MAGTKIKGAQVKSSLTKASQNATIVHCKEDVEEGDILCVTGMHGAFMSVNRGRHTDATQLGPFYVADFAAKAGFIGRIAVDEKIITADTSDRTVGGGLSLYGPGGFVLSGSGGFASSSGGVAIRSGPSLGRILVVGDAETGKVLLKPATMENVFVGRINISSGTTATVTFPNTISFNTSQIHATFGYNPENHHIASADVIDGTLTIRLSGAVSAVGVYIMYSIYL